MWKFHPKKTARTVDQYSIFQGNQAIDYQTWMQLMSTSENFILFFNNILNTSRFEAFFWEVKPIKRSETHHPFEFVLVESTFLPSITASDASFKAHFEEGSTVVSFPNLGGDAQLIVPTPAANTSTYGHLANFARQAPQSQTQTFWKKVAEEFEKALGEERKWLSTAGLGVPWLHVRIDSRPKYYRYKAYKEWPLNG